MSEAQAVYMPEARRERQAVAVPALDALSATPMQLLAVAVQQGADIERISKLMDLQERWEANQARKAFVAAMAEFKRDPPSILKSKQVNIPGGARFAHATLADVVDGVCAALSRHGLSHNWETGQDANGITVTCVLTHQAGHSERTTLSAAPDDSGRKNSIQQMASTVTYLERYTLMAACGLAAKDMDDDGRSAGKEARQANKPENYDRWAADMEAKADDGTAALQEAWKLSPANFRVFAAADGGWWAGVKAKAAKVPA